MQKSLLVLLMVVVVFISCKKENSNTNTNNNTVQLDTLTADVDGVPTTFNVDVDALYANQGTYLEISGDHGNTNNTNMIDLILSGTDNIVPGGGYNSSLYYEDNLGNPYETIGYPPADTAHTTITSLTSTRVRGTFSGRLPLTSYGYGDTIHVITNGKFNLALTNASNSGPFIPGSPGGPIIDSSVWTTAGVRYVADKTYFGSNEYATYGLNATDTTYPYNTIEINFNKRPTAGTYNVINYQTDYPGNNECFFNLYMSSQQYMSSYSNYAAHSTVTVTITNGKIAASFSNVGINLYGTIPVLSLSGSITEQ